MSWIESHQELGRHPKTRRAAKLLSTSRPAVIGHLQYLWWWALDFAQDGDLSGFDAEEITEAALWDGDPGVFYQSMQEAGFIDSDGKLHDWNDYAGRLIDKREQAKDRVRNWRAKRTNSVQSDVTQQQDNVTHNVQECYATTVQDSTVQDNTEPKEEGKNAQARAAKPRFTPPTAHEVADYFRLKNYALLEGKKFFNFYQSKGWRVGKNEMKDWHAAAAGWITRNGLSPPEANGSELQEKSGGISFAEYKRKFEEERREIEARDTE